MPEENLLQSSTTFTPLGNSDTELNDSSTASTIPNEWEISSSPSPFGSSLPNITELQDSSDGSPLQLSELTPTSGEKSSNIFLENSGAESKEDVEKEKENFVSSYIRRFIAASVLTIINILLIGLIFSYRIYLQQTSQISVDKDYEWLVSSYQIYLKDITNLLKINKELEYVGLPINTPADVANIDRITKTIDLTYAEKKAILKAKISSLNTIITTQANDIETTKKDIAKYGFLPQEIREILQNEEAISAIQRSLNSLEIIKFSTAVRVFSYMDSATSLIGDALRMTKDSVVQELELLSQRGEKDITNYVYMCYLNPFETEQDCTTIGDLDLYYQDIAKEPTFNRTIFKGVMKYIDIILEQSDIPSFSILFHGFNPSEGTISFDIEINTTKQDELKLMAKGIKNPHIFILTNLINLLKLSISVIGADINTKTVNVSTRTVEMGNTSYTVNTTSQQFSLPIQKTTEREIFDYLDLDSLLNLDLPVKKAEEVVEEVDIPEIENTENTEDSTVFWEEFSGENEGNTNEGEEFSAEETTEETTDGVIEAGEEEVNYPEPADTTEPPTTTDDNEFFN